MMEIARTYTFGAPPDRVWQLLMDTKALASCIPGCQSLDPDPEVEGRYVIRLAVKLAAVMGTYDGTVQIVDAIPMQSYRLLADGRGRPGFVKGRASITLTSHADATTLTVAGEVEAGGAIARVGQRIVKSAARLTMDRFFRRLQAIAEGRAEAGDALDEAEEESIDRAADDD